MCWYFQKCLEFLAMIFLWIYSLVSLSVVLSQLSLQAVLLGMFLSSGNSDALDYIIVLGSTLGSGC